MTDKKKASKTAISDGIVKLDLREVEKIFKRIKAKGILEQPICIRLTRQPPKELLESGDLMDTIKYYRLLNGLSRLELSNKAQVNDKSYRDYEGKKYEIQDYRVAFRLVEALEITDKVKMPDEFLIKKNYPMDKILELIKEYGKKTFAKRTGICEQTINTWFCKRSAK